MMSVQEVLALIEARGINLFVEDGNLCLDAPDDAVTDDLVPFLKEHKSVMVTILSLPDPIKGEELSRLRCEIGKMALVTPYHKANELQPLQASTKRKVKPSKPQPEHYCYMCEYLEIMGSTWQWDRGIHSWVCSNFLQHTPRKGAKQIDTVTLLQQVNIKKLEHGGIDDRQR